MRITDVDIAKTDPCPGCGAPVRRFPSVPISGSGLDGEPSGPWWCADCLRQKCAAAAAGIASPRPVQDLSQGALL